MQNTEYKLACTATPSPNDHMELGNHSEFLNVMSREEMLAMYFIHDGGETSKWRLKGHSEKDFFAFIKTWALMFLNPSDLGFKETGIKYELPKLNMIEHKIETEIIDKTKIFNETAISATNFNKELKRTVSERMTKVVEIVNKTKDEIPELVKPHTEPNKPDEQDILSPFDNIKPVEED